LLLPAADGTVTQVQVKIAVPAVDPPGSGELIAQVRYKVPVSVSGSPGKPFYFSVSRAIPLSDLSQTGLQLVTFDFSDYPVPSSASHRSLAILYLGLNTAEPQSDGAVAFFVGPNQDRYRRQFLALAPYLNQIVADMGSISALIALDPYHAEYALRRTEPQGEFSYGLIFSRDEQGIWRIQWF